MYIRPYLKTLYRLEKRWHRKKGLAVAISDLLISGVTVPINHHPDLLSCTAEKAGQPFQFAISDRRFDSIVQTCYIQKLVF
jgi:hypothetical protein